MEIKTDTTKFDGTWKLLWRYFGNQRYATAALFLLMLLEIGLTLAIPQVIRYFIVKLQERALSAELMNSALLFVVLVLVQISLRIIRSVLHNHLSWKATNALRYDLTSHILGLDMSFHNTHTPGDLLERIDGDIKRLHHFFSELVPEISGAVILALGTLIVLAFDDWRLSVIFLIFLLTFVVIHRWDQQIAKKFWEKERQYAAEVSSFVEDRISGIREIHTSAAVDYTLDRFHSLLTRHAVQSVKAEIATDTGWSISGAFYALGFALSMGIGAYLFSRGIINLGVVYLSVQYLQLLWTPMTRIGGQLEDLLKAQVSIHRINRLFQIQTTLPLGKGQIFHSDIPIAIVVDKIGFGYDAHHNVLRNLSLSLEPGEKLGLLGRTGSGKSTLARLFFRLYDVERGSIRYNGIDIREFEPSSLRNSISLVTQDVQLLHASVRDNITLFNSDITDQSIIEALTYLGLWEWLDGLPEGLDTQLNPGGEGLSAGQAQLLAITRAFMKNPNLVLLDEASSRVDPLTENLLENAMTKLLANRTSIIIAHRLATVQQVDKILILENGETKEYGQYKLLANNPDSTLSVLLKAGSIEVLA